MTAQPVGVMLQSGALPTNYPDPDQWVPTDQPHNPQSSMQNPQDTTSDKVIGVIPTRRLKPRKTTAKAP